MLNRCVMYDLVELGEVIEIDGEHTFAVRAGGEVFSVMPAADLDMHES